VLQTFLSRSEMYWLCQLLTWSGSFLLKQTRINQVKD